MHGPLQLPRRTARAALTGAALLAFALATSMALVQPAHTATTIVTTEVVGATTLDPSGCAPGELNKTNFGPVQPGTNAFTSDLCEIRFGSSNTTAQLTIRQADGNGSAMYQSTLGNLDPIFDGSGLGNGRIIMGMAAGDDGGSSVAVQADGKVVVGGWCSNGADFDFCVARLLATGAFDPTFDGPSNGNGVVRISMGGAGDDIVRAIAIQNDGAIVAAGDCRVGVDDKACAVRLLPATGALDPTFDGPDGAGNGIVTFPSATLESAAAMDVQPDGRLVLAGECGAAGAKDFCVRRLLPEDGRHDPSFDGPSGNANGFFAFPVGPQGDHANAVAVDESTGSIAIVGQCNTAGSMDFCAAMLDGDGAYVTTFDGPAPMTGNGRILFPLAAGANEYWRAVDFQTDGRIVLAGQCSNGANLDMCAARITAQGGRDGSYVGPVPPVPGFEGAFIVAGGAFDQNGAALFLQPDGKAVISGICGTEACFARLTATGAFDATFDGPTGTSNGMVSIVFGGGSSAAAMAPGADGRIYAAGRCISSGVHDMCSIAMMPGATIDDYVTGGGSDRDWNSGGATSAFGACLRKADGGATGQWSAGVPVCDPTADGSHWHAIPTAAEVVAYTTANEPAPPDAAAHLLFGMRASSSTPVGTYVAPIRFEVVSP